MKGILIKPYLIPAIVEGRKTQTRRLQGFRKINKEPSKWVWTGSRNLEGYIFGKPLPYPSINVVKPRYLVGETVCIKEAWYAEKQYDRLKPSEIPITSLIGYPARDITPDWAGKLRSPMFMPAWVARHFLQITSIRPERLQEITEEDCKAEGIDQFTFARGVLSTNPPDPRWAFIELWDSINPKYPFSSNPFVWVYTFQYQDKE